MISIRPATVDDVSLLRTMIWELADYEREPDSVKITESQLAHDGFAAEPKFQALIAEWERQPAGYAVYFDYYSTWRGRQLFLEDRVGTLEVGKEADIAVWDHDFYTMPADEIRNVKCELTLLRGHIVYQAPSTPVTVR